MRGADSLPNIKMFRSGTEARTSFSAKRVQGLGFGVWGLGFGVEGLGFRV